MRTNSQLNIILNDKFRENILKKEKKLNQLG